MEEGFSQQALREKEEREKEERGEGMNKRKKVITALCIMLAASSPFGIYRLIQWDNETRQKEDGVDLYENTDLVYSTRSRVEVTEKEESSESSDGSTKKNGGSGYGSFHGSSGSSSGSYGGSYSWEKTDPYDVYDYDDPDDFAEEWAEDFGDGDYDDGYDDAYDYWEDECDD